MFINVGESISRFYCGSEPKISTKHRIFLVEPAILRGGIF
jgi:hypothetical protein